MATRKTAEPKPAAAGKKTIQSADTVTSKPAPRSMPKPAAAPRASLDNFDYWLKNSLDKLASGDLRETQLPPRELSARELALADQIIAVREYMADYADRIDVVARGEYAEDWRLRNRYDAIGNSVQKLMRLMDDMTGVLQTVAGGDSDVQVLIKGRDDKLGLAINSVIGTLRDSAEQAEIIAKGDYRTEVKAKSQKDRLGTALSEMTRTLRNVANFMEVLATGDVNQRYESRGDNDLIGQSVTRLSDTLRNASEQVDILSNGNYTAEIQPRGPQDRLGHALFRMTRSLRDTAGIVTQIATGNVNQKIEIKGEGDLLGAAINRVVETLRDTAQRADQIADGDITAQIVPRGDGDALSLALQKMGNKLRALNLEADARQWLGQWQNTLAEQMRGELDYGTLGERVLDVLVKRLDAQVAVIYISNGPKTMKLAASYAFTHRRDASADYSIERGMLGQCLTERKVMVVEDVPPDYMPIGSALGETAPRQLMLVPLEYQGELYGAIEVATLSSFNQQHLALINTMRESIALTISMAKSRERMSELLKESQTQSEELQTQQEELRAANEEMEEQTKALKASEEQLKQQAEELQATNEELEEKTEYLERQRADIGRQNVVLNETRRQVEEKASQLEITSRYKSEFLSNMSHELRTPLNSMLLLARMLEDNEEGTLTTDQLESARVIHSGGKDLLNLINEILDLSKVESGKMTVISEDVPLAGVLGKMRENFGPLAQERGLQLLLEAAADLPATLRTDGQRIEQILKNLLSNAFKFTEKGSISVRIAKPDAHAQFSQPGLRADNCLAIVVSDTGVGIPRDKQQIIFEAFQQVDGSTSRKYGGTGLGLTISRELAKLLGGEIRLESTIGQGSAFTLYVPLSPSAEGGEVVTPQARQAALMTPLIEASPPETVPAANTPDIPSPAVEDDRAATKPGERSILVIEDDLQFGKLVLGLAAKKGFKRLQALNGGDGLALAARFQPSAIILDLGLPDMSGEAVLEKLKYNLDTRHIPVHVVSGRDKDPDLLLKGAVGYLQKPAEKKDLLSIFEQVEALVDNPVREILLIEDDPGSQTSIERLLRNKALTITKVETAEAALEKLLDHQYDLLILDLTLPGMSGQQFLKALHEKMDGAAPPVVVYTGKELTPAEYQDLRAFTDTVVIKGAHSPERLLDEVSLFLHTVESKFSPAQRKMIRMLHDDSATLKGKRVLLVDDDIRNTFALSKVLRNQGLDVTMADDGQLALEKLATGPDFDIVLMDIMMPVMDGYEAMRQIRAQKEFAKLPIIALTAQAMMDDRQKCIAAGASDYLPKPVDIDKLISMMRVWLFERR